MKLLFSVLAFVLASWVCAAQNPGPFSIELDNRPLTDLQSNFELVLPLTSTSSTAGADKGRPNTFTTDMELKRPYQHNSDWKSWVKEFTVNRKRSKSLRVKYTDAQGRQAFLIKNSEAIPTSYRITSDGSEVMTLKVGLIELE